MLALSHNRLAVLLTLCAILSLAACGDDEPPGGDVGTNICAVNAAECAAAGLNCGRVNRPDGTCFSCGTCALGTETCGGSGRANLCGCTPRNCLDLGFECGVQDNMCGGTVECGVCLGGAACLGGTCDRILGPEEVCTQRPESCDAGLRCCSVGTESVCLAPDLNGDCPPPQADIVLDRNITANSISFETLSFQPTSCAISDGCLPGPGTYELLRFDTRMNNIGQEALRAGVPERDPNFVYDMCHMHYHFDGFVDYTLREKLSDGTAGSTVAGGFKFGYCIEDVTRVDASLPGSPEMQVYTCGDGSRPQGLSVGWGDLYEAQLDCQWVNITGVAPGDYWLQLTVNPDRKLVESRYQNNTTLVPVTLP